MPDVALRILDPIVGLLLLACGILAWIRRPRSRAGLLLVATSGCWFLGAAFGFAVFLHRGPYVHFLLSYPTGRLQRPRARFAVVIGYAVCVAEGLVRSPWLTLGLAIFVIVAAVDVYARSSGSARKASGLALAAAIAFTSALVMSSCDVLFGWSIDRAVLAAYDLTIALSTVVLTIELCWGRWTDATVADFVTQLAGRTDTSGLTGELRRALGDPALIVGYWWPARECYVDDQGTPVEIAPTNGRVITSVDDDGAPLAALLHDASVLDHDDLVAGVTSALRLAVVNARMRAEVQARVNDLAVARRRIVEAADEQRRTLEIQLAAGPQRELETVGRLLSQASNRVDPALIGIDEMVAEIRKAQDELRAFAQGVRPAALDREGLTAAVPDLAARCSVPVALDISIGRVAPAVESAVYFLCAEALTNTAKHASAQTASVAIRTEPGHVLVRVEDDGVGGADPDGSGLRALSDRIEALGGELLIMNGPQGGTVITARVPMEIQS